MVLDESMNSKAKGLGTNPSAELSPDNSDCVPEGAKSTRGETSVTDELPKENSCGTAAVTDIRGSTKINTARQAQAKHTEPQIDSVKKRVVESDPEQNRQQEIVRNTDSRSAESMSSKIANRLFSKLRMGQSEHEQQSKETLTTDQVKTLRQMACEATTTSADVAEEIALTLGLAQRIRNDRIEVTDAYDRLEYVLRCLKQDTPAYLTLARNERLNLQFDVYKQAGWLSRWLAKISSGSPVGLVLAALCASLTVWLAGLLIVHGLIKYSGSVLVDQIFFMNGRALTAVASAALIGGIVSIATRLREFARIRDLDPHAMFWTAMFKPLIGVVLSFFLLALLAGDVISFSFLGANPLGFTKDGILPAQGIPGLTDKAVYVLWVLAFLAGFSERFAYDFVDRAQGIASSQGPASSTGAIKK